MSTNNVECKQQQDDDSHLNHALYHPIVTPSPACPNVPVTYKIIIGVGVIVRDDSRVLMGRRLNSHGHGTWAVPGGRVEAGETFIATAVRELKEETGIEISAEVPHVPYIFPPTASSPVVDTKRTSVFEQGTMAVLCPKEKAHMIVSYVVADRPAGSEAVVTEPDKCAGWHWVPWSDLAAIAHYHESLLRGTHVTKPTLSAECPINIDSDMLFAPLHALALTKFVPSQAKPFDINM